VTLDRNKAQYMLFTGERKPATGWRIGTYEMAARVLRGGATAVRGTAAAVID
jgi:hypothetical protein